jgi:hypothetical protein
VSAPELGSLIDKPDDGLVKKVERKNGGNKKITAFNRLKDMQRFYQKHFAYISHPRI